MQLDITSGAIKKIVSDRPSFRFEQKGANSNIGQLQNNIKKATVSDQGAGSKKPPSPAEEISEDTHLQIDLIRITGAQVHVTSPDLKKDVDLEIKSLVFRKPRGKHHVRVRISPQIQRISINCQVKQLLGIDP